MKASMATLAFRNLRRNKRRSVATGLAIATGFAAFMLAAGYAYRVHMVLSNYTIYGLRVGHIGIYKSGALDMFSIKPRDYSLTAADQRTVQEALSQIGQVEMYGRYLTGQGLAGNGCKTFPFMATGVDLGVEQRVMNHPNFLRWNDHLLKARNGANLWDFPEDFGAIALSEGLARLLGKTKIHSELGEAKPVLISDCSAADVRELFGADANVQLAAGTWDGTLGALDGEVVLRYSTGLTETNNTSVTMSVAHLQKLLNTESVGNYSVWIKNPLLRPQVVAEIRSKLAVTAPHLEVLPWTDERLSPYYTGTMHFIYVMVGFIGCVLAMVVILSIFNAATMTVIERAQEVGMFRSVGYNRRTMRRLFVTEGFYLTLIAVVCGALLGYGAMTLINAMGLTIHPPGVSQGIQLLIAPNLLIVTVGAICVSFLGVFSTWVAVSGITRQNIATLVSGPSR
jgi:ABC-type lipoprotein release transport system permease subunit